ncbi:uncharacterized protein LOC129972468 [Argiope bruennichi]|uniref:uncharacterized protein LOC129972468 n=1 Tax=Argiope bruennichi TaxID=94029 RepID=UPI00249572B7|nr:uncharacterized protein LOC129972468 [Argiope bruennichi]
MRLLIWIPRWIITLLLLTNIHVDSHMLHYLHLKKFLTAVAFARALGKRPTILPIPVPIPIPIAQNEVIRIPIAGGGKTMVLDGNKGDNKGISQILGSGAPPIDFTGSSSYGYAMPGISIPNVINLSSMKASDSNVVSLASGLGGSTNGESPRIIVLGGQSSGNALNSLVSGSAPSVIRLNDIGSSNIQLGAGSMNPFGLGGSGLIRGARGMNNFGDLDSSFSIKNPSIFQRPYNVYSDKPRRKFPLKFRGRRTYNNIPESHNQKYREKTYDYRYVSSQEERRPYNVPESFTEEKYKKPIPVGEKFTFRP